MLKRYAARRPDPWELIAIAALLFVPGVGMLLQRKPMIAYPQTYRAELPSIGRHALEIISPDIAHIFGVVAIIFAAVFVGLYVYVRRVNAHDPPPHVSEHGHDRI